METRSFGEHIRAELQDPDFALGYVRAAYSDGGVEELLHAVRDVAASREGGISGVARASGRGRENLYRSLSRQGNPRVKTLESVLGSLGLRLDIVRADIPRP
ncbi:MAG TPA: transcriptional regulator [Armatimonadota bacterium]|jgi:probable addiction module antidote protein